MSGSQDVGGTPVPVEAALFDAVVHGLIELDVIAVSGTDAEEYLQGQLSQNIESLAVGETRWSLLLQPQGKVDAWMRVFRADADHLWLVVDAGFGADALARLERFKLRVDVTMYLERREALALRGPLSLDAATRLGAPAGTQVVDATWGVVAGVDLVPIQADRRAELLAAIGGVEADAEAMELVRILQGRPAMGRELDSSTIPAAAGVVDESVDFTKGCYVGQELVARIDSRGANTPTRLVRVVGVADPPSSELPGTGAPLTVDGADVGRLTSMARSAQRGVAGLAYVKRGVAVPGSATIEPVGQPSFAVELTPLQKPMETSAS